MSLVARLERRFGRFAIPNLTLVLIAGQALLYIASFLPQGIALDRIALIPPRVMQGEVWRLATFLFAPPATRVVIFALIYFSLLHLFGTSLEQYWGAFRYNLFLLTGYVANVAAAFLGSAMMGAFSPDLPDGLRDLAGVAATNAFLYSSIFLAFARVYPDYVLHLFFVLPIRIKWLALVQAIGLGYLFLRSATAGDWMSALLIVATVANYLLFFGPDHIRQWRHGARRRSFQTKAARATASARHVCRVCGLSSEDAPRTLFRYCSKCDGQACYCPEHIRDHEHVPAETPVS
ncbi:MAG TPA: hypothetical protein PJ982_00675 [Lacipirellulaceae bacterium]|nr:hypothetical protein [Lacipirellulaceae bacterium]